MKIFLIGFMFSGKTTIGKKLASLMKMDFVDTDEYFESKYKISIMDFFEKFGKDNFRKYESDVLQELIEKDNIVISTGGGLPCHNKNIDIINKEGVSIYLEMPLGAIINRQKASKQKRPLLKDKTQEEIEQYLKELLQEREPIYKKAQITINALSPELKKLKQWLVNNSLCEC